MNEPETQWHRVFISENVPGYNYLKTLPAGTQVYIEGNYKLRTVEGEGAIRQYANVNVSRTQGLVRVLALPRRYESMNENDGDDLPF